MRIKPLSYRDALGGETVFFPLFQKESLEHEEFFSLLPARTREITRDFSRENFRADAGEVKSLWVPGAKPTRIVLFGWGEKSKWHDRKSPLVARRYVQYAKQERLRGFSTPFGKSLGRGKREAAVIFAREALMAHFEFNRYKQPPKEGWPEVDEISLAADARDLAQIQAGIREGVIVGEEVNRARELANTPGGDMTPEKLAEAARSSARQNGCRAKILDRRDMQRLRMGGVLGVARGSTEKPRFIILEYRKGPKSQKPLVLVGKGVTFDTGGLNLKPERAISEMHMDMSGGAAVIHGMAAVARLKLPVNVVGLVPAVENMPSGSSYHPGDLLKTMSGKTIEVLNTDAEGRVILSDALTYGTRYTPGLIVDFATLTGAAHVALGDYCSALFTNRDALQEKLIEVGKRSGDYVWPMPLWEEYAQDIKGTFGDVANLGKQERSGGAIHGAKFLEEFTGGFPWAHLDIAPRMTATDSEYLAKGATGVGVRYIVELAKEYPNLLREKN